MIGLDAVDQSWVTLEELEEMMEHRTTVYSMLYSDYAAVKEASTDPNYPDWHRGITVLHDSLAAAWMISDEVCDGVPVRLSVETQSPVAFGQTILDASEEGQKHANCLWGKTVNRKEYVRVMAECVANYPKEEEA